MKKNIVFFIGIIIIVSAVGFLLLQLIFSNQSADRLRKIVQLTPPPTRPIMKTGKEIDASGMKKLSFPSFAISLKIPSDLKNHKEIDPTTEDTEIGSNFISLYTSDSLFDSKKHTQTGGVKLSINIIDTKKNFTTEKELIPTQSIANVTEDTSIIPENNALLTSKTIKVYSFPSSINDDTKSWSYTVEALLPNGGNLLDITFFCRDYSSYTESPTCQKLLKDILQTLTH